MTKLPSTNQNSISTFDNENALLYFNILTMKMTKLDFDVFITNLNLSLTLKWYKHYLNPMLVVQDIAEILKGIKTGKLPYLHFIFSFYHFKPSSIIQISSQITSFDN